MAKATFNYMGYDFEFTDSDVIDARYDFIAKGESNPHNVRPWYAHDHGFCLGVCFASCEQDALDILADNDKLDRFLVADEDMADYGEEEEGIARLGNASEPFDIESLGIFSLPHVPFSFAALFMAAQAEQTPTLIGKQYTATQKNHEGHTATVVGVCDRWPKTDMKVRCSCGIEWSSSKETLNQRVGA